MKKLPVVLSLLMLLPLTAVFAQEDQAQRIRASYLLAFNKYATDGEVNYWKTQGNLTMSQLLARHKDYIINNKATEYLGILQGSYTEAFGRPIRDDERNYHMQYPRTYVEMMSSHMQYLNDNPATYDEVIRQSYRNAFNQREATDSEVTYWRGQPKVSHAWLFRAHMEYAQSTRRNRATTNGLLTVPVSSSVLAETKAAVAGLTGNSSLLNSAASMVAAGAGNLIGNDGSTMVAAGAGN